MTKKRLNIFVNGIFYSKFSYCLPVFGHVFGLETYRDISSRYTSYTKEDNRKIQVLQNRVMKLQTGMRAGTPTTTLLKLTKSLSVQQMIAFQTLIMVHKVVYNSRPAYLADRLKLIVDGALDRNRGKLFQASQKLSTSKAGFIYRGSKLFNCLPELLRIEPDLKKFRVGARSWVMETISARPD